MDLAVLVSLEDERGEVAEHIRSWTHGQTLPRDRFQVIVSSPGDDREEDREVQELLAPQDKLIRSHSTDLMGLLNDAAEAAEAPWVVPTEAHCVAEPTCLQALAETLDRVGEVGAVTLEHRNVTSTPLTNAMAKWFDMVYEEWERPDTWMRLNLVGFGIRRDLLVENGGFEPDLGLFAPKLLSAKLHEHGERLGHAPGRINHIIHDGLEDQTGFAEDYILGECRARFRHDPRFFERYFGHRDLLWQAAWQGHRTGLRLMGALGTALLRASARRTGDVRWLAREISRRLPGAVAPGARPAWDRIVLRLEQQAGEHVPLPSRARLAVVLSAQARAVRMTQHQWMRAHALHDPRPPGRAGSVLELGPAELGGVHGVEEQDGRPMRWTKPVSVIRLGPQPGGRVAIDTGGLRGRPLAYVAEVFLGGRRVSRRLLEEKEDLLTVPIERSDAPSELILLCRPLTVAGDPRTLGLPLFGLGLDPST